MKKFHLKVCHGQACIKGTRIPVYLIVSMLAYGDTIDELLEAYPSIKREDILACLTQRVILGMKMFSEAESHEGSFLY